MSELKLSITEATEVISVVTRRQREVTTLISRKTITESEKTKLETELKELESKLEMNKNVVQISQSKLTSTESSYTSIQENIRTTTSYVTEITTVITTLEKKVEQTTHAMEEKIETTTSTSVTREIEENEEEETIVDTQIESLSKHVVEILVKEETFEEKTITVSKESTTSTFELKQIQLRKVTLERKRQKQRCARIFPNIFSGAKIKQELNNNNMCPCPQGGRGRSQIVINDIEDPEEYNDSVLYLFEKSLVIESSFTA